MKGYEYTIHKRAHFKLNIGFKMWKSVKNKYEKIYIKTTMKQISVTHMESN